MRGRPPCLPFLREAASARRVASRVIVASCHIGVRRSAHASATGAVPRDTCARQVLGVMPSMSATRAVVSMADGAGDLVSRMLPR